MLTDGCDILESKVMGSMDIVSILPPHIHLPIVIEIRHIFEVNLVAIEFAMIMNVDDCLVFAQGVPYFLCDLVSPLVFVEFAILRWLADIEGSLAHKLLILMIT